MDATRTSLEGIASGFDQLDRAAHMVARDDPTGTLPAAMVEAMKARHQVHANVAALRTAEEMIGSLLDVFA